MNIPTLIIGKIKFQGGVGCVCGRGGETGGWGEGVGGWGWGVERLSGIK